MLGLEKLGLNNLSQLIIIGYVAMVLILTVVKSPADSASWAGTNLVKVVVAIAGSELYSLTSMWWARKKAKDKVMVNAQTKEKV